ncbi:hypothetical protein SynBIOSE41_02036 [Synechococcus sp. BIOS-E4-1]|nr:hypothetical protein SynBIOSE41_02036 [Synechococcus sp. BIOS-E4-1]
MNELADSSLPVRQLHQGICLMQLAVHKKAVQVTYTVVDSIFEWMSSAIA